jgi:hypothetical protein
MQNPTRPTQIKLKRPQQSSIDDLGQTAQLRSGSRDQVLRAHSISQLVRFETRTMVAIPGFGSPMFGAEYETGRARGLRVRWLGSGNNPAAGREPVRNQSSGDGEEKRRFVRRGV